VNRTVGWVEHRETHHGLMVNTAIIRPFRIKDIHDIMEIEGRAIPKSAYPKALILEYARAYPDGFLVLETGGEVAGYLIYDRRQGHILSMAVRPLHRRKGLGSVLFTHARNHARKRLWLEVRSKNTGAVQFYARLGMTVRGRVPNYYETDDALIMILEEESGAGARS